MAIKKVYTNENLDRIDFSNRCFVGVHFVNCSLRKCMFNGCDLSYVRFENCDLYESTFDYAVLYHTRIKDCDATKAVFNKSFLSGIRILNTVIIRTNFGNDFKTHKERKSVEVCDVNNKYLLVNLGDKIDKITSIEQKYEGIYISDTEIAIKFYEISNEAFEKRKWESIYKNPDWRAWRRKSDIAIMIKRILEENGMKDQSLHYYYLHRVHLRRTMLNPFQAALDYLVNDQFWGYGVKSRQPILFFYINTLVFSIIYSILPYVNKFSGLKLNDEIILICTKDEDGSICFSLLAFVKVYYYSLLLSCLAVFGDMDIVGYGKIFAIMHVMISVLLIGLGITALAKKLANV